MFEPWCNEEPGYYWDLGQCRAEDPWGESEPYPDWDEDPEYDLGNPPWPVWPIIPQEPDAETLCAIIVEEEAASDCDPMTEQWRDWIWAMWPDDEDYREEYEPCALMKEVMDDVLNDAEMGLLGSEGNYPAFVPFSGGNHLGGVWFDSEILLYSQAGQEFVIVHEAYHIYANDEDNGMADAAANYCLELTETNPWA